MKDRDIDVPYETLEMGTPRDYSSDMYKVYFEVGERDGFVLNVLSEYLGSEKSKSIRTLPHGYELELPIQVIPEVVRLLCANNIAVYQVMRYAKTQNTWA
jgi:hypothetical protein